MEIKSPAELQAWLDLLVTSGVEEFEGFGIHVRFTPAMFSKEKEVPSPEQVFDIPISSEPANSIWEQPSLWPGGKPPSFPK